MAYIGNEAQTAFTSFDKQTITGTGTSVYTLSHNVANEQEIEVFVNNVRQEGGSGKAYTVSGNQITFSENIASTDTVYVNFQGKAVQTVTHPSDQPLQATTGTFSGAVSGTTGTFSGAVSGTTGTFTGDITTSGSIDSGAEITTTGTVKIKSGSQENKQFVQREVLRGDLNTSWKNILTITPSNTTSIWYRNLIIINASGHHSGVGNGARFNACFYFDNNNNTMSGGQVSAGTTSGNAPNFQVVVSGSTFILQGQVSSNSYNGLFDVTVLCQQGAGGTSDFTITRNIS